MIWVTTTDRRAALEVASDAIYAVVRDFFEQEAQRMARIFGRQPEVPSGADIEAAVDRALSEYDWGRWNRILRPALEPALMAAYRDGVRSAWDALAQANISLTWDTIAPLAVHYARQRAAELVGMRVLPDGQVVPAQDVKMRIDQATRRALHFSLAQWLKEGRSWSDIARQLERFDGWQGTYMSDWRARRIARTEAAFAYNRGNLAAYREAGVEHVRVFDGTMDAPCAEANGQVWTLEEAERRPLQHPHCSRHFAAVLDSAAAGADAGGATPSRQADEPPESFATAAEAESWARSRWPNVQWDISDMDPQAARAVVAQMNRLMREFPEVAKRVTYVGTYSNDAGAWRRWSEWGETTWAHATPDGAIAINPRWGRDAEAWLESIRRSIRDRSVKGLPFHAPGTDTIEAVITHEFAHLIQQWITEDARGLAFMPFVRASGFGLIQDTFATLNRELYMAKPLTGYAAEQDRPGHDPSWEAWAEAVTVVYHGTPEYKRKAPAQSARAFLDVLRGPKWEQGEWRWFNDALDSVKESMIQRFEDLAKRLRWTWR